MTAPGDDSSRTTQEQQPPDASERGRLPLIVWIAVALLFGGYLGLVAWYTSPHAGGSDGSGYLNSAKLLSEGKLDTELRRPHWTKDVLPAHIFVPLGFVASPDATRASPTYPIGQPLHLALAAKLVGFTWATTAVNLVGTIACFSLLYLTARRFGVRQVWALALVIVYAMSPLVFSYALQPMSELTATTWIIAAIYFGLRSRDNAVWSTACGFSFALAVLVRPSNLLAALPLIICLGGSGRRLLGTALGGLPGAVFLGWYNHTLYGSAFTTGYGQVGGLFSLEYAWPTLEHYLIWTPVLFTPLIFGAFAMPFARIPRRDVLTLGTWAGSFLLFYATYAYTRDVWWTLRFILPAMPAVMISSALVLQDLDRPCFTLAITGPCPATPPDRWRRTTFTIFTLLFPLAISWQWTWTRHFKVEQTESGERIFKEMAEWGDKNLPFDALIACGQLTGSMYFYTNRPCIHISSIDGAARDAIQRATLEHDVPFFALLVDHEETDAFRILPGQWERVQKVRQGHVWRWKPASTSPVGRVGLTFPSHHLRVSHGSD